MNMWHSIEALCDLAFLFAMVLYNSVKRQSALEQRRFMQRRITNLRKCHLSSTSRALALQMQVDVLKQERLTLMRRLNECDPGWAMVQRPAWVTTELNPLYAAIITNLDVPR